MTWVMLGHFDFGDFRRHFNLGDVKGFFYFGDIIKHFYLGGIEDTCTWVTLESTDWLLLKGTWVPLKDTDLSAVSRLFDLSDLRGHYNFSNLKRTH